MGTKQEKTVLGDDIWFNTLKLPLNGNSKKKCETHQLWRCRKHKRIEAKCLENLPLNSSFLDCGAHFGDTVLTMAIHARQCGRTDLRFFAFEPSKRKCQFIKEMIKLNKLENSVHIVNACVGDKVRMCQKIQEEGFVRHDGRNAYKESKGEESSVIDDDLFYFSNIYQHKTKGEESHIILSDSDSDSDEDLEERFQMISLDSMYDIIMPLGLLHLDIEGWEPAALRGASTILTDTKKKLKSSFSCYIICEVWDSKDEKRRSLAVRRESTTIIGKNSKNNNDKKHHYSSSKAVLDIMITHSHFERLQDIVDQERNMFFQCTGKE